MPGHPGAPVLLPYSHWGINMSERQHTDKDARF